MNKGKDQGKGFEKGKGNGFEKGKGKATGKGSWMPTSTWSTPTWTNPTKGKSKGEGYHGICFSCGVVGHKAAECQGVAWIEEGEVEEVHQIDAAWIIGQVEKQKAKTKKNLEPMKVKCRILSPFSRNPK